MTEYIHETFGSRAVLQNIRNQNLQRELLLMRDDSDRQRYELLEKTTDEQSVFAMPTTYKVLSSHGETEELRGWMNFTSLALNDLERDNFLRRYNNETFAIGTQGFISSYVLQRIDNNHEIVILSTWQLKKNWTDWQANSNFSLKRYEHSQYNLRTKQLSFAAFTKQNI